MRKFRTTLLGAFLFALLLAPLFISCNPSANTDDSLLKITVTFTDEGNEPVTMYLQIPEVFEADEEGVFYMTLFTYDNAACTEESDWVVEWVKDEDQSYFQIFNFTGFELDLEHKECTLYERNEIKSIVVNGVKYTLEEPR